MSFDFDFSLSSDGPGVQRGHPPPLRVHLLPGDGGFHRRGPPGVLPGGAQRCGGGRCRRLVAALAGGRAHRLRRLRGEGKER